MTTIYLSRCEADCLEQVLIDEIDTINEFLLECDLDDSIVPKEQLSHLNEKLSHCKSILNSLFYESRSNISHDIT